MCTSSVAFRTRNTFVVSALCALLFSIAKISVVTCVLHAVLLERGILCLLCILRGAFRTRNSLFLCTSHGDFRTRNTHVVCANNEVLLKQGTLFDCALHAVLLEREILHFFLRTSRVAFQHNKDYCCCLCTLRGDFRMRNTLVI